MRLALTLVRKPGESKFAVLTGPEVPLPEQVKTFKGLTADRFCPDLAEIQLWESGSGMTRQRKFRAPNVALVITPETPPAPVENLEDLTIPQLSALAAKEGIDLGVARLKADIIAAIELVREQGPTLDDLGVFPPA